MDPLWHTGWSVVVTGLAHEVTDPEDRARLDGADIPYWAPWPPATASSRSPPR